jgi:hypothetical protein
MIEQHTIYVRPSTVTSNALCPARTGLRGTEGFNYYPNEALLFGTLVHWMIEMTLKEIDWTATDAEDYLHEAFLNDVPKAVGLNLIPLNKVTSKQQRVVLVKEAMVAWSLWQSMVHPSLPKGEPDVEVEIEQRIGYIYGESAQEYNVVLRGTPDAWYPQAGVFVDWKTAGRGWAPDKAEGQLQRIGYPMMKESINVASFDFWVFDRSAQWWERFRTPPGGGPEVRAFAANAMQVARYELEQATTYTPSGGGFKSRGWHCSPQYCDAWAVCDGKYLVADGRADDKPLTLKERWS